MIRLGAILVGLALAVALVVGCRARTSSQPPAQPVATPPLPTAQHPGYFIVDRDTLMYHRQDCPQLPPPGRRALVDPKMIEYTASVSKPCPICRPDQKQPAGKEQNKRVGE